MEYRIKEKHRLRTPVYLTPGSKNKADIEAQLEVIINENHDDDLSYEIVYGNYYAQGAENGTFAEFPEPPND